MFINWNQKYDKSQYLLTVTDLIILQMSFSEMAI